MCLGRKDRILGALGRGKHEGKIGWGGGGLVGYVKSKEVEVDPLAFETCTGSGPGLPSSAIPPGPHGDTRLRPILS